MNETETINKKLLKKKFKELLETIEENKIKLIGEFLETEVLPYMSIREFSEIINEEGYSERTLYRYLEVFQKIYKGKLSQCDNDLSLDKQEIISRVDNEFARNEFIERAKEISREELREEVNHYLEKGELPSDNTQSEIQMNLKYNHAVVKLVNEMRMLTVALKQVRNENLFINFNPTQKKAFRDRLYRIKEQYSELMEEIENADKYLN